MKHCRITSVVPLFPMKIKKQPLQLEFKIWIPCEAVSESIDKHIADLLSLAGGMTEEQVIGVWVSEDGETVQEDVHLLSFIAPDIIANVEIKEHIDSVVELLLEEGQEAVLISEGGHHFLISGEVEEVNKDIKFSWRKV